MPDTIGRRIAQRRKMLSLSQESLGEKMGVSRQAISKWEADASIPELDRLMDMSKLFDVSLDWLISGEDVPPLEEPDPDLTDTITQTLQPPPPQDTPLPESEPAPSRPPKPRKEPSRLPWPMLACICLTIASLLLSLLCLTRIPQQAPDTTDDEAQLQAQIDALKEEHAALTQALTDLDEEFGRAHHFLMVLSGQQDTLLDEMTVLSKIYELAPGLPVDLPSYESLSTWWIDGEASEDLSTVTIDFSCIPVSETVSIRLQVYQDEKLHQSLDCLLVDRSYQCRFTLPSENGYRYILLLEQPDGSVERLTLEGHGLSDLADLTLPRLHITYDTPPVYLSSDYTEFWESLPQIRLQIPALTPDSPQVVWSDLWLCHYKNGQYLEEFYLMEERTLEDVDMTDQVIRFRVNTPTYHTGGVENGDRHQIFLTGKLEINGNPIPFSFLVLDLTYQNCELISNNN